MCHVFLVGMGRVSLKTEAEKDLLRIKLKRHIINSYIVEARNCL